jgi:hypothetical protein
MGSDLLAVDATCARMIGFDTVKVRDLNIGSRYLDQIRADRILQRRKPRSAVASFDVLNESRKRRLGVRL